MNQIDAEQIAAIDRLTDAGHGVRAISRLTGINRGTVGRYRRQRNTEIKCGCGQDAMHKGWCTFRFAHSENRQKFMAEWVGWKPKSLDDIYWSLKGLQTPEHDDCFFGAAND